MMGVKRQQVGCLAPTRHLYENYHLIPVRKPLDLTRLFEFVFHIVINQSKEK
jgi:hypothetical protein